MQFLYMAPAGLVQIGNDGEIVMVNPLCAQLLMPLVRDGILTNLFIALEDVAPDLRHRADSFKEPSGTICDGLQLHVATFRSGCKESQVLSLSLFKLDATRLMGVFNDVTHAVRREPELKLSQAWIHSIAVGLNDYAMVSLDETGVCQTWSPNVQKVTGFRQSVIHGRSCAVFYPPHSMSTQRVLDRLHEADVSGWSLDEGWRQHADGSRYWGNCLIVPSSCNATDLLVEKRSYDLILCDVSERQAAYDARQDLLSRDHLTGLSNRRALFEAAELEFQRWNRVPRPMTVVMIDIDHFKQVNDRYGHAAGDAVLCQLAAAMSASFGPMDTLARLGGEEFVALLPGRTVEEAAGAAESLRHRVEQHPAEVGEHLIRYTISAGVSEMKTGVADVNALFQLADTAMYAAKKNGRNCVKL